MQPDRLPRIPARNHPRPFMIIHDQLLSFLRKPNQIRKNVPIGTDSLGQRAAALSGCRTYRADAEDVGR
jgi:hypothetical protein